MCSSEGSGAAKAVKAMNPKRSVLLGQPSANAPSPLQASRAQAARPLAGGSPPAALGREQILQTALALVALRQTGQMNLRPLFFETLARSLLNQPQSRATERQFKVRPNPSLERTSTGKALGPRGYSAYPPPRGPNASPVPAAQLKR